MNASDTCPADILETREFLIATMVALILGTAAILYVFHGFHESPDPFYLVISRLDILFRRWPLLMLIGVLYASYLVVEFIALHTCCKPQHPVIIARPIHKIP